MSMSILYHAFGIKGVTYRSTHYLGNAVFFHVETTDRHVLCPKCGPRLCIFRGRKPDGYVCHQLGGNRPFSN